MKHTIFYCAFKLKKGVSVDDFLAAAKALNDGYISKQKGYIEWEQYNDGEIWADAVRFETMEDAKAFEENSANAGELAEKFYSFLNLIGCKVHYFRYRTARKREIKNDKRTTNRRMLEV